MTTEDATRLTGIRIGACHSPRWYADGAHFLLRLLDAETARAAAVESALADACAHFGVKDVEALKTMMVNLGANCVREKARADAEHLRADKAEARLTALGWAKEGEPAPLKVSAAPGSFELESDDDRETEAWVDALAAESAPVATKSTPLVSWRKRAEAAEARLLALDSKDCETFERLKERAEKAERGHRGIRRGLRCDFR